MAVLFKAGDHVPVIPFVEDVGSGLKKSPLQIGALELNVGVVFELTTIVNDAVSAHEPDGSGVKT